MHTCQAYVSYSVSVFILRIPHCIHMCMVDRLVILCECVHTVDPLLYTYVWMAGLLVILCECVHIVDPPLYTHVHGRPARHTL